MEIEKYIIFKNGFVDVFAKEKIHSWRADREEVISAGFWDGEKAFGESTTLGVKSRPEDTKLILQALTLQKEGGED